MKINQLKQLLNKYQSISAIWRNQDFDLPIEIVGLAGKDKQNHVYVAVEGSNSGVPFREIVFSKEYLENL